MQVGCENIFEGAADVLWAVWWQSTWNKGEALLFPLDPFSTRARLDGPRLAEHILCLAALAPLLRNGAA